jgi:Flp pilus assembly pilin Flp
LTPASARRPDVVGIEKGKGMDANLCIVSAWLRAKLEGERGANFVEYGMLVALIAIMAMIAVKAFGAGVSSQFSTIASTVG